MLKRLLFPTSAFLVLALASTLSPEPARAGHCNNKVCWNGWMCRIATGGPSSHCIDGGESCAWDWCETTE
jgi:hypothetical protein